MVSLFGTDPPVERFADSLNRIYDIINSLWPRVVGAGVDVILDFAFWERQARYSARHLASQAGAATRLYYVHCSEATARERCRTRNADLQGSLFISDDTFDVLRSRVEPLGPDEAYVFIDTEPHGP
jgi:predicted kinase